jgi:cation diffusion facilitator CzcD-associated flavoprotein CzcO
VTTRGEAPFVLIVGAGPTGLLLASDLQRRGDAIHVERKGHDIADAWAVFDTTIEGWDETDLTWRRGRLRPDPP